VLGIVDSLCDLTGNMVRPWAEAGYECNCYDIQPPKVLVEEFPSGGIIRHWTRNVMSLNFDGRRRAAVFAFPPCTDLSSSGARWFAVKGLQTLIDALDVVEACRRYCDESGAPWMLENPVGRLSTCWRKPDFMFHPFEYAGYPGGESDTYTKRTCLWTGGGFVMPEKRTIEGAEIDDRIHKMPPSADRGNLRSVTPMGFAYAVFAANYDCVARPVTHVAIKDTEVPF
jgi:hypothetical protein